MEHVLGSYFIAFFVLAFIIIRSVYQYKAAKSELHRLELSHVNKKEMAK